MFLSKRFCILLIIFIDFEILFLIYNMCQFNLCVFFCISFWAAINDDKLVIIFDSCMMKHHIISFFLLIVNLLACSHKSTRFNS